MVVISASICTKSGKILLARQFIPITKLKLEEYMANFPKLIDQGKQCTHIETDSIRYVYLPMEKLFLVLITNKNSNIIEDLEVIRQLQQVVIQQCQQGVDEKIVNKKAFDLFLSFDDVITHGYRESVTMSQIESYLEMDSTDEKMHKKMQLIREADAKEFAKKRQREIAKTKLDPNYKDNQKSMSSDSYQGNTGGATTGSQSNSNQNQQIITQTQKPSWLSEDTQVTSSQTKKAPGKAMQLGKPKKQNELLKDLKKENLYNESLNKEESKGFEDSNQAHQEQIVNPLLENVIVEIEEKVNCTVNKDGDVDKFEIKGIIFLTINDPKKNNPLVQIQYNQQKGFVFKPHPDIDKQNWTKQKRITSIDQQQNQGGFPANARLDAVRYRYTSKDEKDLPFSVNVFNSKKQNKNVVTIEVEANQDSTFAYQKLERITIGMNVGQSSIGQDIEILKKNNVVEMEQGGSGMMLWYITDIKEGNAVLSFSSEKVQFEDLFPIEIRFDETYSLIDARVEQVTNVLNGDPMSLKLIHSLQTENYKITSE